MKLLLHICCAPCTIYPLQTLRNQSFQITGYFYNPNIHPYREFEKRENTLKEYAGIANLEIYFDDRYDLELFLNQTQPWGPERCRTCYQIRMEATARQAKAEGFEAFSTTLLYSRYQKHDWIREGGTRIGERLEIPFLYQDFRPGWTEGVRKSKELGLYHQPYCGCIFSEKERFAKKERK
jgi:epoxyqueuosine reductase